MLKFELFGTCYNDNYLALNRFGAEMRMDFGKCAPHIFLVHFCQFAAHAAFSVRPEVGDEVGKGLYQPKR